MIKFGTGGWRSIIGDEFVKSNIVKVGQAMADLMREENVTNNGVVIGYDKRFLSDKASKWLAEVLAGNGIKVFYNDKVAPTPLLMYSVKKLDCSYGIAVTASHNPADYNGIKIFTRGGKDADLDVTDKLEKYIETYSEDSIKTTEFELAVKEQTIEKINFFNDYIDTIINLVDVESIRKKGLRILVDPMFGVSKAALQTVLLTARCEVDVINDKHDTQFGGRMPSPSDATLNKLKDMVFEQEYDLGIGTDGDADRLGIIDENGLFVNPNQIMSLLYYYLLKYKKWEGPVVRNIATTHLLDKIATHYGQESYEVPVGFKHISQKMHETGAIIGGESSGGLTIKGHVKGKDGIFAAALLVEMISVTGLRIRDMLKEVETQFGNHIMIEENLSLSNEQKKDLKKSIFEEKCVPDFEFNISKVSYMDGLKIYFETGGWLIARFSGTEPLLRVFVEMDSMEKSNNVMDAFCKEMKLRRIS